MKAGFLMAESRLKKTKSMRVISTFRLCRLLRDYNRAFPLKRVRIPTERKTKKREPEVNQAPLNVSQNPLLTSSTLLPLGNIQTNFDIALSQIAMLLLLLLLTFCRDCSRSEKLEHARLFARLIAALLLLKK